MRALIVSLCGLFLMASMAGCGSATIPSPPDNAKPGPPPGASADLVKAKEKPKK